MPSSNEVELTISSKRDIKNHDRRAATVSMRHLLLGVVATAAIWATATEDASAGSRTWDRDVTDSVGADSTYVGNTVLDHGYLYWTDFLTAGPAGRAEQLLQMNVDSGQIRTIAFVPFGVIGNVVADGGRVGFTTHRRARSHDRGRLIDTESAVYSMAATDESPALLTTTTATSRFALKKRRNGRSWRTIRLRTCGALPTVQDVSETGRLLTLTRTMECTGDSDPWGEFFAFEPGSTVAISLGPAEAQLTGLLRQNHLVDMGNLNLDTGDRRPSSRDLSTSTKTRYSTSGFTLGLTGGPGGHFAATVDQSRFVRYRGVKLDIESHLIFSLGNSKPLARVDFVPAVEISSVVLCDDGFVQLRAFPDAYKTRLIFRDYSGKVLRTIKGPHGSDVPVAAECTGRTLSLAIYNNADFEIDRFPFSVRRYEL